MFGRQAKKEASGPESDRRQVKRGSVPSAFSYYNTARGMSEVGRERRDADRSDRPDTGSHAKRFSFAQLPFWVFVLLICVCVGKALLLSTSPRIVVLGGNTIAQAYLQPTGTYAAAAQKLFGSSATNRLKLTVNTEGISRSLKHQFPELSDVSVGVPLISSRPIVYLQPAGASLALQSIHGSYVLNSDGVVLAATRVLPAGVPVVVDQSNLTPRPGKQLLSSGVVSFLQVVSYQFQAARLAISAFVLPAGSPYELDVRLEGRPYAIRFNVEADALTQSGAAIAIVQQLGSGVTPAQYIDVRVPGRVYYK